MSAPWDPETASSGPNPGRSRMWWGLGAVTVALLVVACTLAIQQGLLAQKAELLLTDRSAFTQRDLDRMNLAFNRRTMADAYQKVGEHNAAWDGQAAKFLDSLATWVALPLSVKRDDLISQGKALDDLGCTDLMVQYGYGLLLRDADRPQDAEVPLRRAAAGLVERGYSRFRAADAARMLATTYRKLGGDQDPEARRYFDLHLQYLNESLGDGTFSAGEERLPLDDMVDWSRGLYVGREREVYDSLQRNPKADPYLTKVMGGMYHIAAAWQARGEGWGDQVTEKGWKEFDVHIEAARKLLTEAWELNQKLPHAPAEMIVVEGATGDPETTRLWFNRVVAAQVDYISAYIDYLWFLWPSWGGSHGEMYAFGLECLKTKRFDTDVPMVFARALRDITEDAEGDTSYWRKKGVYELLEGMFAAYAKAQPEKHLWLESVHAAAAYGSGKTEQARQLLDQLGGGIDEAAFQSYAGVDPSLARQQIQAESAPSGSAVVAGARHVLTASTSSPRPRTHSSSSTRGRSASRSAAGPGASPTLARRSSTRSLSRAKSKGQRSTHTS